MEMKKLKSDDNIVDRLSELPDSLILEILSLLKMRDVVKTTLLSKRWKGLWVTIPCLNFIEFRINFVYNALRLWRGTNLREFSIFCSSDSESPALLSVDMSLLVQFAMERKVEDLSIKFSHSWILELCPPQCLYDCSSIRKLSLYDCNLQIRGNAKWDSLNTLNLSNCVFSEDVMNQVFSSSPQLETFTASCNHPFQNWSIRSSSLKKLEICYYGDIPSVLTILAPNLQVLKYLGTPCAKCLLTDISSLTEIELSASCFQVLRAIEGNYSFSPLSNVKLVTIDCWLMSEKLSDVICLLESFPKLKMVIINWRSIGMQFKIDVVNYTESEPNVLKSNLLQLRTVVITWDDSFYNVSSFELIEFLLEHVTTIEKMVIRKEGEVNLKELFEAAQKLMSLQRSFPSVELILYQS